MAFVLDAKIRMWDAEALRYSRSHGSAVPGNDVVSVIKILFVCSRARLRSPTAAEVFSRREGVETDCAGLSPDADTPLSSDLLDWADHIVVMEASHKSKLSKKFRTVLAGRKIHVLGIPDDYDFMQPELVALLEKRVSGKLIP